MKNYILVCDIGTQSCRASLVSSNGEILTMESIKYEVPYNSPKNGYVEQDPNFYYNNIIKCTKAISEKNGELLGFCKSMVITAFRDSACYLDENFNIVRPTILWLDQRTARLDEKMPWYDNLIFGIVGMGKTVEYNRKRTPANWLKENEPVNWNKIKYYVPLTAYWNYKLTGNLADSNANVVGHYPINFKKGVWYGPNHPRTHVFGIPVDKLCKLVPVGEIIGTITAEASLESGIPVGTKLIASGADKACEVLGDGCISNEGAAISYGTACTIDIANKKYRTPETFLPGYKAAIPDLYNLEVQIYRGYWMVKWFIKEFIPQSEQDNIDSSITIEELLDKKILEIEPGCNGLVLQPYWGPGLKRPLARGAIVGFSDVHTKYHVYRAIIEGICFALKEGMESIRKRTKRKIKYLVVSGGGSKNDIIAQITADIFNIPVLKTDTSEACTIGGAMSGFLAEGVFKDVDEAKKNMVKYVKTFTPNKEAAKKYEYLYKNVYKEIYPKLNKCYSNLKEFSRNEIL